MDASPDVLLTERVGAHVLLVTLNRPQRRNAIDAALAGALAAAVRAAEEDDAIRAVVLTGAGARCFCAGADLKEVAAGRGEALSVGGDGLGGFVHARRAKPWIAALRGTAVGGGLELALACEMIVAGDDASLVLPEVRRGLLAGAGGVYRLPRALPRALALEMLLAGTPISATRAHAHGMVNYLVPDDQVLAIAIALATAIADNAPLAVRASLAIARDAFAGSEKELRERTEAAIGRLGESADAREGVAAFLDKRAPQWTAQ